MHILTAMYLISIAVSSEQVAQDPVPQILSMFDSARLVAIGENHGHVEFHQLILRLLEHPGASGVIDDVAVEWGNSLYQDVMDRYIRGAEVPWDSVTMAWRNTVVSPNVVWDAPVYENFFKAVRQINLTRSPGARYRVLLTDSPVDWSAVDSLAQLVPFFDRAKSMADVIRTESLLKGRRALFLAGALHVSRIPRVKTNQAGVPIGEITPIAWLELFHPGSTYVFQSMGSATRLGLQELLGEGPPRIVVLDTREGPGKLAANRTTTLRNRDGSTVDVYGDHVLAEITDAVIIWDPREVTLLDADFEAYQLDWYWDELNRRSVILTGRPMDPSLRNSRQWNPARYQTNEAVERWGDSKSERMMIPMNTRASSRRLSVRAQLIRKVV